MRDLIDRQAAIDELIAMREHIDAGMSVIGCTAYEMAIEALRQPERKKGKWIRHDEIKNVYGGICIECSECGEKYVVQHIEDEKYCRNCGADMRGEKE